MQDTERSVRSDEARRHLRNLLNEVERDGARIVILRYDTPSAVLVPVEWYQRMRLLSDAQG